MELAAERISPLLRAHAHFEPSGADGPADGAPEPFCVVMQETSPGGATFGQGEQTISIVIRTEMPASRLALERHAEWHGKQHAQIRARLAGWTPSLQASKAVTSFHQRRVPSQPIWDPDSESTLVTSTYVIRLAPQE